MTTSAPRARFVHPEKTVQLFGVEPGTIVADFGAGSGHYALAFGRAVGADGRVFAIDVQYDLLRRIRNEAKTRGLSNIEIIHSNIERAHGSTLGRRSVDLVFISNLLFQLENALAALIEARRIVRRDGHVVIIDWFDSFSGMGPHRHSVVPKEKANSLAAEAGLSPLGDFDAGAYHYGLVMRPQHSA